jgi:hypothetical protein
MFFINDPEIFALLNRDHPKLSQNHVFLVALPYFKQAHFVVASGIHPKTYPMTALWLTSV